MKKKILTLAFIAAASVAMGSANASGQNPSFVHTPDEAVLQRFLSYVRIESQSMDDPDPDAFPMTEGQRQMAALVADEIRGFKGKGVEVTVSEDQYVYIKIPSNLSGTRKSEVPSIMFTAHLDVTPECEGRGISPQVHRNYDGGDIVLSPGNVLNPRSPEGARLNLLRGKTIVTSDGTTLLGADDKTGITILTTVIEEIVRNPKFRHPDLYFVFSQNEDVGRAAARWEAQQVFNANPDIVFDIDGEEASNFSVENFTASAQNFTFDGNSVHPSNGADLGYADALTAAGFFLGCIPPEVHPSASRGKQGYLHCYTIENPTDSLGHPIREDWRLKLRIRYFDQAEGETLRKYLADAYEKTQAAYPFVKIERSNEFVQYENVAYTMYPGTVDIVETVVKRWGLDMRPQTTRGGTTAAMIAAKGMNGGACLYSGQQNAHSRFEWCCVEDMTMMIRIVEDIISEAQNYKKN